MAKKTKPKQPAKPKKGDTGRACGQFCGVFGPTGERCRKPCLKPRNHPGFHTCGDHRHTDPDF